MKTKSSLALFLTLFFYLKSYMFIKIVRSDLTSIIIICVLNYKRSFILFFLFSLDFYFVIHQWVHTHTHILQTYFKLDSIFFSVLRKFCDLFYNLPVYVSLWKLIVAQVISLCYRTFSIVRITIKSNIPVIVRQLRNCKEIN